MKINRKILLILILLLFIPSNKSLFYVAPEAPVEAASKTKKLNDLEQYLRRKKIIKGQREYAAYELINATNGAKYNNNTIEIYEYNPSSRYYKEVVKKNKMEVWGIEAKYSAINGKFILFCDKAKNKKDIIKAFKAFK